MYNQLTEIKSRDSKLFWSTIDNIKNTKKTNHNPISITQWDTYFRGLLNSENTPGNFPDISSKIKDDSVLNAPFNCKEIKQALATLKNKKSTGIDLIRNEFLKFGSSILVLPIVNFFNRILQSGEFPVLWNISNISVIHKNGSLHDCDNYRGISICSCLGKLFTKLLQNRVSNFLKDNNLIEDNQAGFKSDYRTTDQIFIIKTIINKYLYKSKKPVFACFVDFTKAFDSVWREALFFKIQSLGIGGNIYNVIKSMYSNTYFCIKKDNYLSQPVQNNLGVKQGDSLSPTLFNIYINDFGDTLRSCKNTDPIGLGTKHLNHLLFADDLLLLSESSTGLQKCISQLEDYCEKWRLNVNLKKTKIMIFI